MKNYIIHSVFSFRMAKNDKVRLPSSGAGITQYFDDVKSNYEIQPMHVIIAGVVLAVLIILLRGF